MQPHPASTDPSTRNRTPRLPQARRLLAPAAAWLACLAAPAYGSVDFGIPHVEISGDDDLELAFEFLPVTYSGGDDDDDDDDDEGVPTATLFTSSFNPLAGEYTTQPLAGPSSGFVNDDAGFRSASPLLRANIRLTFDSIVPGSTPAFILFGTTVFTEASVGASITLGNNFDLHPTYGLLSSDPAFTGSATWNFSIDDAQGAFDDTLSFALKLSANPVDAVTASLIPGDFDGSGTVEQGDLDLVLLNWGLNVAGGVPAGWVTDLPQGQVDQAELDRVLLNWGSATTPSFTSTAVPEPAVLAAAAVALFTLRRCPPGSRARRHPRRSAAAAMAGLQGQRLSSP